MCSRVTYNEIHLIEFKEIISIQLQFHSITYLKYLFYYKYLLIYLIQTQLEVQSLALVCWLIHSYIHRTPSTRKTVLPLTTWGTSGFSDVERQRAGQEEYKQNKITRWFQRVINDMKKKLFSFFRSVDQKRTLYKSGNCCCCC